MPGFARLSIGVTTCVVVVAMATTACSFFAADDSESQLAALYQGSSVSPVTEAPRPQPGKKVWIITPDEAVDVMGEMARGAADAARLIGWVPTVVDANGQQDRLSTGVQRAVAANADGIILAGVDCAWVQAALASARYADIPVVGAESQDCQPTLETVIGYASALGGTFDDVERNGGVAFARYVIEKTGHSGTLIELKQTDLVATLLVSEGYESTVQADCSGCTNVVVQFTQSDIGPALQDKTLQALREHPDATALTAPYDGVITGGAAAAVRAAGRAGSLTVVGAGGSSANLDLIRRGLGQTADLVASTRWEGFATVDWLNRLLNGVTPDADTAGTGIGYQLVDAEHNLPPSGPVPSPVDFEGIYAKAWGVRP